MASEQQLSSSGRVVAIIGAGPVGISLAKRLIAAEYTVTISNSRGPDSLRQQESDSGATAMKVEDALPPAEIVFLAVPMGSIPALQPMLQSSLRPEAIIIDSGNYYPSRDKHIEVLDTDRCTETEWLARTISRPDIVKVFNNIVALNIFRSAKTSKDSSAERVVLPVSGDNAKTKEKVMALVQQVGFTPYDAGSLGDSWRQQPGTPAYCTEPTSSEQLVRLLGAADRAKAKKLRDSSREIFDQLPADYDPDVLMRVSRLSAGMDMFSPRTWTSAGYFLWTVTKLKWKGSL